MARGRGRLVVGRPRLDIRRCRIQALDVELEDKRRRVKGSSQSLTVYNCTAKRAMQIIRAAFERLEGRDKRGRPR